MARYIDADKVMEEIASMGGHGLCEWSTLGVKALIDRQHTADVVEVVRCKDCRFCQNLPNGLCYAWTEPATNERGYKGEVHCVDPDDFCSMGKRMEGGE